MFPFGQPQPTDPAKPRRTSKTVWNMVRSDAGVKGRWHDNRNTFITGLTESGEATGQTIMDLAGHIPKEILKHYCYIRTEAERRAVDSLVRNGRKTPETIESSTIVERPVKESAKVEVLN